MQQGQPPQGPPQVRHVPVYDEFITKHFVFTMANDGSTEPKKVGEWMTQKSLVGYDLITKAVEFVDGKLHVYVSMKKMAERKFPLPAGTINTKVVPVGMM